MAIATTSTASVTATTTTTAGSFLAGPGLIDGQGAALPFLAVQSLDRRIRTFFRGHGNETEATRFPGRSILHEIGFSDRAMRREQIVQIVFGAVEGEVSHVQFRVHIIFRLD